jgi:diaminopimelate decarboxylase/ribulose-5-phosphate 4-epimerase/fuculose-1-phosphate aldolase
MRSHDRTKVLPPEAWGLTVDHTDALMVGGCSTLYLAREYGTPLHVVHRDRLLATATAFTRAFTSLYPAAVSVHYAFKCNAVPGIVQLLRQAGLRAEVSTPFELLLARRLGFPGSAIIVNGPGKTPEFLRLSIEHDVRFVVVDALDELSALDAQTQALSTDVAVLLRINPDYVPRGMNRGSATGCRRGCAFGLDLRSGEVDRALDLLKEKDHLHFKGFHIHIGTGIRDAADYRRALHRLGPLIERTRRRRLPIPVIDVGGGFGVPTSREMTTLEMLAYQGWGRLPSPARPNATLTFDHLAEAVTAGLHDLFPMDEMPELVVEPGRSIVSPNQFLLLTVLGVKPRRGVGTWLVTDGGLGTVTTPTYYEYHEVFACNGVHHPRTERVQIIGPACFAGDVVYRNKPMPPVRTGDVLAVMDSGAYFTAMESSFGFPRPAVVAVSGTQHALLRRRETFDDTIARDAVRAPASDGPPGDPAGTRALRFAVLRTDADPIRDRIADEIVARFESRGHTLATLDDDIDWVLNLTDAEAPRAFKRRSRTVFVVSLVALREPVTDMRSLTYSTLVRTLSNLLVCAVPANGTRGNGAERQPELYLTTPEVGFYHYPFDPDRACESILPVVGSRMLIANRLTADLPPRFGTTSPVVEQLKHYGKELDRLGVLPAPFPLRDVLRQEEIDDLYRLFQVKGLSYGNLSAREDVPELGDCTFWMTARGVNKAALAGIGRDVLLVTGYDVDDGTMLVSVPPAHDPTTRVSVDAIEHHLIYRSFPEVGAIVHVHAWMDDVPSTRQNYPCGTIDLADEVVRLLADQPHPERTVVGLKNHGLTITGPELGDIFDRIRGRLLPQVPMFG